MLSSFRRDEGCFKVLCKGFSDSFEGFHSLQKKAQRLPWHTHTQYYCTWYNIIILCTNISPWSGRQRVHWSRPQTWTGWSCQLHSHQSTTSDPEIIKDRNGLNYRFSSRTETALAMAHTMHQINNKASSLLISWGKKMWSSCALIVVGKWEYPIPSCVYTL